MVVPRTWLKSSTCSSYYHITGTSPTNDPFGLKSVMNPDCTYTVLGLDIVIFPAEFAGSVHIVGIVASAGGMNIVQWAHGSRSLAFALSAHMCFDASVHKAEKSKCLESPVYVHLVHTVVPFVASMC